MLALESNVASRPVSPAISAICSSVSSPLQMRSNGWVVVPSKMDTEASLTKLAAMLLRSVGAK